MRYDMLIYFQKNVSGEYNPETGDYAEDTVEETQRLASVMDTKSEMMKLVYDGPEQGSLTIHLQNHYVKKFNQIRIGRKIYHVDYSRKLRIKHIFIVSEVQ